MTDRDEILNRLRPGAGLALLQQSEAKQLAGLPGRVLGGYRVGRLLAEGGMSHVFLGERTDGEYERTVAIKVIATGAFSPMLRDRYELEKDILSRLNHPNIAHLYDAGNTDEGWAYLVMEYVEGTTIDVYCREQELSAEGCVDLLLQIASAVSYAHRHLIVHRDIKPSNVIVTNDGTAKLLDFGIAKLLHGSDGQTTIGGIMSPIYASPEQLQGNPVGVESDVYQLGLLLLVLLGEDVQSLQRPVPSLVERLANERSLSVSPALRANLPTDLIVILEKALRTDPAKRYLSVETLISDLRNFRTGYPISARPPGAWYVATRYVSRNRAAALVAAISSCAIIGVSVGYTIELSRSEQVAASRAASSERMLSAMTSILNETHYQLIRSGAVDGEPKDGIIRNEPLRYVLQRTEQVLEQELTQEPAARAQLLHLQGTTNAVLNELEQSLAKLSEARKLAQQLDDTELELRILLDVASTLDHQGDLPGATETVAGAFAHPAFATADPELQSRALVMRGRLAVNGGDYLAAREDLHKAITELEGHPAGPTTLLADAYKIMADTWLVPELIEEGRTWALKSVDAYTRAAGDRYYGLRSAYSAVGWTHQAHGEYEEALAKFSQARDISDYNFGTTSRNTAAEMNNMAMSLRGLGRFDEAVEMYEQCINIYQALYDKPNYQLAVSYSNMGNANADRGNMATASDNYERGLELSRQFSSKSERVRALLHNNLGRHLVDLGDLEAGKHNLEESLQLKSARFDPDSPSIARTRLALAEAALQGGNNEQAAALTVQAGVALEKAYAQKPWRLGRLREVQGRLALADSDFTRAATLLSQARDMRREEFGVGHPKSLYPSLLLAATALTQGDHDSATSWLERSAPAKQLAATHPTRVEWELLHLRTLRSAGDTEQALAAARQLRSVLMTTYSLRNDWLQILDGVNETPRAFI